MKLLLTVLTLLVFALPASAQQAIFVVRHAERADTASGGAAMTGSDPDLSEAGRTRAASLAAVLKDAKIGAIYTTQYKRTRQTAEPLAKALGIEPTAVDSRDIAALMQKLKDGRNALIVGHSNSVGAIIKELGVAETVTLADDEYDNLFIVLRSETPTLIRLHFR